MAQSPVHTRAKPGKPFGRQAIWQAIRAHRRFTLSGIAKAAGSHPATAKTYIDSLTKAGYLARDTAFGVMWWDLVKDIGIEAPRLRRDGTPIPPTARDHMWRAMKMLKGVWSWRDLAFAASTEDLRVNEQDAKDYCKHLATAGYLQLVEAGRGIGGVKGRKGTGGGIPDRYRFVPSRNTGPRAPMVQRLQTVFDPNLSQVMHQEAPHDD